jgi:hypothetical protein
MAPCCTTWAGIRCSLFCLTMEILDRPRRLARGRKSLLEPSPNSATMERKHLRQHPQRLLHRVDDGAGDALVDDFRNGVPGGMQGQVCRMPSPIMTKPNGSSQSIGNKSACASPRNSVLSSDDITKIPDAAFSSFQWSFLYRRYPAIGFTLHTAIGPATRFRVPR